MLENFAPRVVELYNAEVIRKTSRRVFFNLWTVVLASPQVVSIAKISKRRLGHPQ